MSERLFGPNKARELGGEGRVQTTQYHKKTSEQAICELIDEYSEDIERKINLMQDYSEQYDDDIIALDRSPMSLKRRVLRKAFHIFCQFCLCFQFLCAYTVLVFVFGRVRASPLLVSGVCVCVFTSGCVPRFSRLFAVARRYCGFCFCFLIVTNQVRADGNRPRGGGGTSDSPRGVYPLAARRSS